MRREERRVEKSEERGAEVVKVRREERRGWRKVKKRRERVEKGDKSGKVMRNGEQRVDNRWKRREGRGRGKREERISGR